MQPLNIMQRHLTKFKPSLLQRLGEEKLREEHWNLEGIVMNRPNLEDTSILMPKLMNSSHSSVENLRIQRNTLQEVLLTTTAISMELPIRDREFLNPKCHGSPEKRKPDEAATKTVRNHAEYSTSSLMTTKSLNNGFRLPKLRLRDSQHPRTTSQHRCSVLITAPHFSS